MTIRPLSSANEKLWPTSARVLTCLGSLSLVIIVSACSSSSDNTASPVEMSNQEGQTNPDTNALLAVQRADHGCKPVNYEQGDALVPSLNTVGYPSFPLPLVDLDAAVLDLGLGINATGFINNAIAAYAASGNAYAQCNHVIFEEHVCTALPGVVNPVIEGSKLRFDTYAGGVLFGSHEHEFLEGGALAIRTETPKANIEIIRRPDGSEVMTYSSVELVNGDGVQIETLENADCSGSISASDRNGGQIEASTDGTWTNASEPSMSFSFTACNRDTGDLYCNNFVSVTR